MKYLYLFLGLILISCSSKKSGKEANDIEERKDPHSFSEPDQAVVKHLDLDLAVDFSSQIIKGKASWQIENLGQTDTIIFDVRQLKILKVTLDTSRSAAPFVLGREEKYLGKPLKIKIEPSTRIVNIWYETMPGAAALQWLKPQQTAGKKQPFLFTQSQAILARTWIPCQDSPGIRFTYNARVTVPRNLLALMSASNPQEKSSDGVYSFRQIRPIPSYLMALAVGDIQFRAIDHRTGVYAEPVQLNAAAWEFADVGKMVTAAESLYGPYQWGRYDLLVLPPSFPFGGMENPMLTFATPTVIAGDRSLVSLVAHELAHSWSGNLVTNATWNDFWLNEGFTTYIERRIIEEVYGKEEARMQEVLGYKLLQDALNELGEKSDDTKLKGNFDGRDPDEGVTDIPYEKGYSFLRVIEQAVGRYKFDLFLNQYFIDHKFKSISTEDFVLYLQKNLYVSDPKISDKIKASEWIYEPGIPSNRVPVSSKKFAEIDSLIAAWRGTIDVSGLKSKLRSTNELIYFIRALPDRLSPEQMATIDGEFNFTDSRNAEIQCSWYTLAIRNHYARAYPKIEAFLTEVGRRKFVLPLYKEMIKTPEGKEWAKKVYKEARPNYHSVTYSTIDELIK